MLGHSVNGLIAETNPRAWFEDYSYRRKITIPQSKITENIDAFPVLFHYIPSGDDYFVTTNNITSAITDSNDNLIPFEIQYYTNKTELIAWLLLDLKKDHDNIFYFYYDTGKTNRENKSALWNEYNLVHHFENTFADSANSHNATNNGTADILGKIGRARNFSNNLISVPYSADLNPENFTVSFWFKRNGGSGHRSIMTSRRNSPQRGYIVYVTPDNTIQFWTGQESGWSVVGSPACNDNTWYYVTITRNGTEKKLYVNNQEFTGNANYSRNDIAQLNIGGGDQDGSQYRFPGVIDEVRISQNVKSFYQHKLEQLNQDDPSSFYSIGEIETI